MAAEEVEVEVSGGGGGVEGAIGGAVFDFDFQILGAFKFNTIIFSGIYVMFWCGPI